MSLKKSGNYSKTAIILQKQISLVIVFIGGVYG